MIVFFKRTQVIRVMIRTESITSNVKVSGEEKQITLYTLWREYEQVFLVLKQIYMIETNAKLWASVM